MQDHRAPVRRPLHLLLIMAIVATVGLSPGAAGAETVNGLHTGPIDDMANGAFHRPVMHTVSLQGGFVNMDMPEVDFGTSVVDGDTLPLSMSEDELDGFTVGIQAKFDVLDDWVGHRDREQDLIGEYIRHAIYATFNHTHVDGDRSAELAPGAGDYCIVYEMPAPNNSLGINLGNGGALSEFDTEYDIYEAGVGTWCDRPLLGRDDTVLSLNVGLGASAEKLDHDGWTRSLQFNDALMRARYKIDSYRVGPEVGATVTHRVADTGLSVFLNSRVMPHYFHHKLDYTQWTEVGGAPAEEQMLRFDRSDSEDGIGLNASLEVGAAWALTDNLSVSLAGVLGWTSHAAQPDTRIDETDDPTHVDTDDSTSVAGIVGIRLNY
ncbi:MAG: hypothetical protein WD009_00915 [Phycisphaeraceae bacterium]